MAGPTVVVSVLADSANMRKGFADINNEAGKLGGGLGTLAKIGGAALLAVGAAVAGVVASSIKAAAESQVIAAQTTAVLASTAHSANRTAEEISKLATDLSRLSGIDDEVIQSAQNVLLTFTQIKGTTFDAAAKAALDLSTAMGTDLNSAALLVGKALNDPIKGMSALSRAGVQLSTEQRDLITSLVEVGDVAGAQAILLAELETQFGGSAAAFGNTYEGALGKVKTGIGNLQETIGAAFLPAMTETLNKVAEVINAVGDSPAFNNIVVGIGEFVTSLLSGSGAASTFGDAFSVIMAFLNPFSLVLQAVAPLLPELAGAFMGLAQAIGGALIGLLPTLTGLIQTLVSALSGVFAAVLPVVIGLITQLAGIFTELLPVLTPVITLVGGILADALVQLVPIIAQVAEFVGQVLSTALTAIAPLLTMAAEFLGVLFEALSPLIPAVLSIVEAFLPLLPVLGDLIGALLPVLVELLMAVLEPVLALVSPLLDLLIPVIQFLADVLGFLVGIIAAVVSAFVGLITGSEETYAGVQAVWENVLSFFEGIPAAIGAFFAGAAQWLVSAGSNIIQGLINGINAAVEQVWSLISDIGDNIASTFADVLGIKSPSLVFRKLGKFIPEGLVKGVKDGLSSVTAVAGAMGDAVVNGFGTGSPSFSGGYSSASGNNYTIMLPVGMPAAEAGRAIVDAIDEYERLNGKR